MINSSVVHDVDASDYSNTSKEYQQMYLQNKYTRTYNNIIIRAKSRSKPLEYTERHHIIPRSLGGSNDKDNLVILTAREHFIVHQLLTRMVTGKAKNKMIHALWRMTNCKNQQYKITSKLYQTIREQFVQVHTGFKHTTETKELLRQVHLGKKRSAESRAKQSQTNKGRKQSEEWIQNVKNAKAKKPFKHSTESKAKISQVHKGKIVSAETRRRISEARKRYIALNG